MIVEASHHSSAARMSVAGTRPTLTRSASQKAMKSALVRLWWFSTCSMPLRTASALPPFLLRWCTCAHARDAALARRHERMSACIPSTHGARPHSLAHAHSKGHRDPVWPLRGKVLQHPERLVGAAVVDKREEHAGVLCLLTALRVTAGDTDLSCPPRGARRHPIARVPRRARRACARGARPRTSSAVNCRNFWMGRRFSSL